ncbi:hypothetical protein F4776DRAFT_455964 [Hypoxylon sp. NC0597]|nr:hypothetical protein F4776DRAFT_455964 [Hypoxylon sp. NC0597]
MKAAIFRVALLAAAASVDAQTTTADTTSSGSSTTACAAQNILDACLQTTESYVSLCATTDYMCLCDKYIAIMTCFSNCPSDPREPSYQQQKDLYCINASLYATVSGNKTISRSMTSTWSPEPTTTSDMKKTAEVTSAKATATASEAFQTGNGAQERLSHAGGMLAGVAGVIAAFL